jgi:trimethylamine--corrinoid protein Co-methyltransferase
MIVADALPNIHFGDGWEFYMERYGIPPCMVMLEGLASGIRNSSKVERIGYADDCEVFGIQMAQAVGMELVGGSLAAPPLTYYSDAIESQIRFAEAGFPGWAASCPIYGATGPATIAGSMATGNAEMIGGIVLAQLIKPGARMIASSFTFPINMRTGSPAFGDISLSLFNTMFNQMCRRYGLPTWNAGLGFSSSKRIDFQNGYERAIMSSISALSGSNIIHLHGAVSSELSYNPLMAILDDDIAGMIGRFIEGVKVNDETLALDLIEEVGPVPGYYLNKEHTRKWWRSESFVPKACDRLTYPEWIEAGKKNALDYAKERMKEILATHKPTPLTARQEEGVERILEEARKYYKEKGLISDAEMAEYKKAIGSMSA